jgi:hypothetical protein
MNYRKWYRAAMAEARIKFGKDAVKEVTEGGQVILKGADIISARNTVTPYKEQDN